jgi:hypothetical protein
MNQRIRELAEQAGFHLDSLSDDVILPLETFIELLAQECIAVIEQTPTTSAYTTYDLGTVQSTIAKSVNILKELFKEDR